MPVPVPRILGHAADLGVLALEDLGDVTLQAHLGAAPRGRARRAVPRGGGVHRHVSAPRARARRRRVPAVRHRVRRREADVGAGLLPQAFLEAYRGVVLADPRARGAAGRAARAIVDELAAEPRVLCHRDYHSRNLMLRDEPALHHRLPGRAARARTPTTSCRCCATRTSICPSRSSTSSSPTSSRCRAGRPSADGVPPALRSDGAAAQPQGARHVRLSDDGARAIRCTSSTSRARCNYVRENLRQLPAVRRPRGRFWRAHVEELRVTPLRALDAPVSRRAARRSGTSTRIRRHGFDLVEVFATRTHFDYHDPRARRRRCAAGSPRSASRPAACTRRSPTASSPASGAARTRTRRRTPPAVRRRSTRRARRSTRPRRSAAGRRPPPRPAARPADSAGDNDAGRHARSLEPIAEACTAPGVRLALEVIPNDLADAGARSSTGSTATSSSATPASASTSATRTSSAARPRRPRRSSGHVITTHVHDNDGRDDDPPRAVRRHHRLAGDADGAVEDRLHRAARLRGRRSRRRRRRAAAARLARGPAFRRYWTTWRTRSRSK